MESTKYLALAAAIALGVAVIMGLSFSDAFGAGSDAGAAVYNKKCLSCHPVKEGAHKLGPSLAGMFGRKAGTVAGYTKYRGLIGSDLVWNESNLDGFLENPKKFLGKRTTMVYKLKNAKERRLVIEYMKVIK